MEQQQQHGVEATHKKQDGLHEPVNPSNQQPTEAGKQGAKSSEEMMFEAYGDTYATRSAGEGFGERYGSGHPVNVFDKNVKGELAEELGIPELKNRDKVAKDIPSEDPGKK